MAYTKQEWDEAKRLFEKGLSLSAIEAKTGIGKSQLSRKSNANRWGKHLSKTYTNNDLRDAKSGYIYLITTEKDEPLYKIGIATDIQSRLKSLQSGNPHLLMLKGCYYSKHMYSDESYWHEKFKDNRYLNEWFKLTPENVEEFMEHSNRDLENHLIYLESLLESNNIDFKKLEWK